MNRKFVPVLLVLLFIAACLVAPAAAAKDYSADRYDVTWDVQEDGSLLITETVVFRFEGGPFTYVYRELPLDYCDGIVDIRATLDGVPLPAGDAAGQAELTGRDPIKVTWHFAPASDAVHTFGLSYRALGVVRQEAEADLLRWHALPTDYDYRITQAALTVRYPASVRLLADPEVERGRAGVSATAGQVIFTATDLRSDSDLLVALRFAPGSLISAPPGWQARAAQARASAPAWGAAALGALLAGILGLWASAARWRQERQPEPSAFHPSSPPGDLAPAVAGVLTTAGGQIGWSHALATLFGLAQRGALRIDEAGERKWYRSREFVMTRLGQPADLRPHEVGLLDLLFTTRRGTTDTVKLSELASRVGAQLKRFSKPLEEELIAAGLFDPGRMRARSRYLVIGVVLMLLSLALLALGVILMPRFDGWPLLVAFSTFLVALIAMITSGAFSPLSERGAGLRAQWQGFQAYLRDVTRGREPAYDPRTFDHYLPYAASFGLAEPWAKALSKQAGAQIPAWFGTLASTPEAGMTAFVAMTAASHSAGSSSAGGGAGGAGGGGGSGAG